MRPRTLAARAAGACDPGTGAVVPPVHPSASYLRSPAGDYPGGHSYTRDQNPTYEPAEALLAQLEGGAEALLFASGMAAATTALEALDPGAHVVAPDAMYWTVRRWLEDLAARGRIGLDLFGAGDLDALEAALRPGETRLVWLESPSNPLAVVTDLGAAAERAHRAGARVLVDSTTATPVLTRPLELGADLVLHSATKQLNGHTDVLAGALVAARRDAFWERIRYERGYRGAVLGPFEAWLLLRGMRTLPLRVAASCAGAQRVAEFLDGRPEVEAVLYPGLPSHPGHDVASRQMDGGFGSLLSFRMRGGEPAARAWLAGLRGIRIASSLGGVETLAEHRASVEGAGTAVPGDLLRLSIGIEDPDDLVEELEAAFGRTSGTGSRPGERAAESRARR